MYGIILKLEQFFIQQYHNWYKLSKMGVCRVSKWGGGRKKKVAKYLTWLLKIMYIVAYSALFGLVCLSECSCGRHVTTKWTISQYKTFNEIIQIQQGKKMRLFLESPLSQSLTKERKVSPMCYCVQVQMALSLWCWVYPPPPLHLIIDKIIYIKNNLFCNWNFQSSIESWGLNSDPHTMCMDIIIPKAKISLILQHFLFYPSPNLRHLHTPHSRNPIKYVTVW